MIRRPLFFSEEEQMTIHHDKLLYGKVASLQSDLSEEELLAMAGALKKSEPPESEAKSPESEAKSPETEEKSQKKLEKTEKRAKK